jgi:uncharacterized protein (TIGR02246 family)
VNIESFMHGYQAAWEQRDPAMFAALFQPDGQYHNTPFQVQRGTEQLVEYWKRVQLQEDVEVTFEVLASTATSGVAHWHVTYQVMSEELFSIWARSPVRLSLHASLTILCHEWCSMASSRPRSAAACARRRASGGTACPSMHEAPGGLKAPMLDFGAQALVLGGVLSAAAAVAHVACIALGAPAYRFMGAGESMARAAEAGKIRPTLITLAIAGLLLVWAFYAFSGAGVAPALPFTNPALALISAVYLARALAFPLLRPVFPQNTTTFWLVSSGACLVLGLLYAIGAAAAWTKQ